MSDNAIELSIIMPCLNEEKTLGICIEKAQRWLQESQVSGEIIVSDNGSTDRSIEIAQELGVKVIQVAEKGYGAALYGASLVASGRYLIMGDADESYDFLALNPFLEKLRSGYDLVIGNRFQGGIRPRAMPWKNRYIGNPALSFIGRLFFGTPISDFHCGLRGISKQVFLELELVTTGMEYASEMVIKAQLLGKRIVEVPTVLYPDGRDRKPHLRPWRDGWRHLSFMLLYSPRWLFWYPGWAAIIVGLTLLLAIYPQPVVFIALRLDIHTMLFAMLFVVAGYQTLSLGIIARNIGTQLGLLPRQRYLDQFGGLLSGKWGVLAGVSAICLGIYGLLRQLFNWGVGGFGDLMPSQSMRLLIPYALCFIIGIQTILNVLILSFIDVKRR